MVICFDIKDRHSDSILFMKGFLLGKEIEYENTLGIKKNTTRFEVDCKTPRYAYEVLDVLYHLDEDYHDQALCLLDKIKNWEQEYNKVQKWFDELQVEP